MSDPTPETSPDIPPRVDGPIKRLFLGPSGIRAFWSIVLFIAVTVVAALVVLIPARTALSHLVPKTSPSTVAQSSPAAVALPAVLLVVPLLIATLVMGLIEHRSLWRYGYGDRHAARHFAGGLGWGLLALSTLVGLLAATGHLTLGGVTEPTPAALRYAVKWGVAFLAVGLFEETSARGYLQATLTRGIGFWPAAVLLSVLFGAAHSGNPGETTIGLVGAGAAGFVFCYSLWCSGSLWWAIGFHTAWDWSQSYLYGTADSGVVSTGRLFAAHPLGADWLSGGSVGPEGSVLVFVILLAVIFVIRWTLTPPPGGPYAAPPTLPVSDSPAPHA